MVCARLFPIVCVRYFSIIPLSEGMTIKSWASLVSLFVRRYHTSVSRLNTQLGALRNAWGLLEGTENHLPVCLQQCAASHKLFVYPSAPSLRMGLREEEVRSPRRLTSRLLSDI